MPVIINDLEVIIDPPGQAAGAEVPVAASAGGAAPLAPQTVVRIEEHRRARAARIRAH